MFYVYVIQNKLNYKLYVGKTNDMKRRLREHKKVALGGKKKYGKNFRAIHAALKKYGVDNFVHFDIERYEQESEAFEAEEFWIEFFQSHRKNLGYNETLGGEGFKSGVNHPCYGTHPSEETRQKLSIAHKGRQTTLGMKHSQETKANMSEQRKGEGNAMYGKHHSEEGKKHISEAKLASPKNNGETHRMAKLSNKQATEIRALFAEGNMRKSEIAKLYGVSWNIVHGIIANRTYKIKSP